MRLALVMSHAERGLQGAFRELHLLAALRARGVDARLFCQHGDKAEQLRMLEDQVPVHLLPPDDATQPPRARLSSALVAALKQFAPDMLLFRGLGHPLNLAVANALHPCPFGLIVGGGLRDPLLPRAALVLVEHEAQAQNAFPTHHKAGRTLRLPKFFDPELAATPDPPVKQRFAIINVGGFQDPRKNQAALLELGRRNTVCLVGGGALLEATREGAPPRMNFIGPRAPKQVYTLLHQARIMVHSSLRDGLPRAIVEAMACGLPVVAFRDVIEGGIRHGETGLLVTPETLEEEVTALLADEPRRAAMGEAARADAFAHHGPEALQRTAREFLSLQARLGLD